MLRSAWKTRFLFCVRTDTFGSETCSFVHKLFILGPKTNIFLDCIKMLCSAWKTTFKFWVVFEFRV